MYVEAKEILRQMRIGEARALVTFLGCEELICMRTTSAGNRLLSFRPGLPQGRLTPSRTMPPKPRLAQNQNYHDPENPNYERGYVVFVPFHHSQAPSAPLVVQADNPNTCTSQLDRDWIPGFYFLTHSPRSQSTLTPVHIRVRVIQTALPNRL